MADVEWSTGIDQKGFESGMQGMRARAQLLGNQIGGAFSGAFGRFFSVAAVVPVIGNLLEKADRIRALSQRFGALAPIESIQRIDAAASQSASSLEDVMKGLTVAHKAAVEAASGNEKYSETFAEMGIDAVGFLSLPIEQRLLALARGYRKAETDGRGLESVIGILGQKLGPELVPLLAQTEVQLGSLLGSVAPQSAEAVSALADVNDAITRIKKSTQSIGIGALNLVVKGAKAISDFVAPPIPPREDGPSTTAGFKPMPTESEIRAGAKIAEQKRMEADKQALSAKKVTDEKAAQAAEEEKTRAEQERALNLEFRIAELRGDADVVAREEARLRLASAWQEYQMAKGTKDERRRSLELSQAQRAFDESKRASNPPAKPNASRDDRIAAKMAGGMSESDARREVRDEMAGEGKAGRRASRFLERAAAGPEGVRGSLMDPKNVGALWENERRNPKGQVSVLYGTGANPNAAASGAAAAAAASGGAASAAAGPSGGGAAEQTKILADILKLLQGEAS